MKQTCSPSLSPGRPGANLHRACASLRVDCSPNPRLVTRPDTKDTLLLNFLEWAQEQLSSADSGDVRGMVALTGVLSALATVFKLGKRQDLLCHGKTVPMLLPATLACDRA